MELQPLDSDPMHPCTTRLEPLHIDEPSMTDQYPRSGMNVLLFHWLQGPVEQRPALLHRIAH